MVGPLSHLGERWTRSRFQRQTKKLLPELYRVARTLTGEPADAEDLVHDAFVKAFRAYPSSGLRNARECRAWLFKIMVNTYRDRYRRRLRSPEFSPATHAGDCGEYDIIELARSPEPGPHARLEQTRFTEAAQVVIEELPPEVRLVVVLFFLQGMTYKEIAQVADCAVGTVMSRLWRGRQILRTRLRDYTEPLPGTSDEDAEAACTRPAQRRGREHDL